MTPAASNGSLRVVVADDSRLMRRILASALESAGFDVVGTACDGDEALALCERARPDVMTLDLAMPGRDGIGVLKALAKPGSPEVRVVVVSAFSPAHGARAVDALAEGAFDLVAKPAVGEGLGSFTTELAQKVLLAGSARPGRRNGAAPKAVASAPGGPPAPSAPRRAGRASRGRLVMIASSTGGPRALGELVPRLPAPLGAGTLIVQHMPPGFTSSLAARLDRLAPLTVREAATGDAIAPGTALLAPGGSHLRVDDDYRVRLSDEAAIGALRPRADLTISDVARVFGPRLLLVVLTGMGRDGLEGARDVRRRGGRVLVEAESTCAVYGMPRAVAEAGLAHAIVELGELPAAIAQEVAS